MRKQTIFVDGHTIGFQFNRKSLGFRTFRNRTVTTEDEKTGTVHIPSIERTIRVRRISTSSCWEAY